MRPILLRADNSIANGNMMGQSAFRNKAGLLTASLFLTLAAAAILAYALNYWKTTRDQLAALNKRVVALRQEQLHLNQAMLVSQRELRQQRLQMITAQQHAATPPSTDPTPSDKIDNPSMESPGATPRRSGQPSRQAATTAVSLLEMALQKTRSGRKVDEIIALLEQAREQLRQYAGFDSAIESLDFEIEKLYSLQQLQNRLPEILLQSLTHEVQWLRFRDSAAPRELHEETSYTAESPIPARRLLREHLREARSALSNRHEAQFHAALQDLQGIYAGHFLPQPDFSKKLRQLMSTQISPATLDPSAGISRLLQQLGKSNDGHTEVEKRPSAGLNFTTKPADASSRTVRPPDPS